MVDLAPYTACQGQEAAWPKATGDGSMRILVIEDDKKTADYILKGLAECGYTTDWAKDGRDGLHRATGGRYDAIIVDRMLPGLDGLAIVKALRAAEIPVPVLILSALAHVDERVTGLRAGGDDYLPSPLPSPSFRRASRRCCAARPPSPSRPNCRWTTCGWTCWPAR